MNGPFLFAWVDPDELTFNETHHRVDEEIFSFSLNHNEGEFPTLDLTILNPREGLLAPGRKVWAWFALNKSWTPETASESEPSDVDVRPLFFGRLVGVPEDMPGEAVRISFVARPVDFDDQRSDLAEALRVAPYWDGIWFDAQTRDDPDNVLESRSALWHTDRVTNQVTISDIITGEDGDITVGPDEVFYDSVRISHGQAAVRRVTMHAEANWTQSAAGQVRVNIPPIVSLTAPGVVNDWPKAGANIGGGWEVVSTVVSGPTNPSRVPEEHEDATTPLSPLPTYRQTVEWGNNNPTSKYVKGYQGKFAPWYGFSGTEAKIWFPEQVVNGTLFVGYSANRERKETLSFTLEADMQALLTEPGDEEVLEVTMRSGEIVDTVDGEMPLGDLRKAVYFSTPRGTQSVEYLLCVARARLLARSRAVTVDFEIPFELGVDLELSCRKNAILQDDRLPGGLAGGKITSYSLALDGDTGATTCQISIGCTIGKGNTVTGTEGDPVYANPGYMNPGYQRYTNKFVMPIVGEITYESIEGLGPDDDGVDFFRMTRARCVRSLAITGTIEEQKQAIRSGLNDAAADVPELFDRLNAAKTAVRLEMVPVTGGPFTTDFPLNVSLLMVPKTIDLEATS